MATKKKKKTEPESSILEGEEFIGNLGDRMIIEDGKIKLVKKE